jgi:nucleoside phosphorylase
MSMELRFAQVGILASLREERAAIQEAVAALPALSKRIQIVDSGVGYKAAEAAVEKLLEDRTITVVCSTGFCGALSHNLRVGALFVAETVAGRARGLSKHLSDVRVRRPSGRIAVPEGEVGLHPPRLAAGDPNAAPLVRSAPTGRPSESGPWSGGPTALFAADPEAIARAAAALRTNRIRFQTGTLVTMSRPVSTPEEKREVDMEAAAAAWIAQVHGRRFLAMRAVSDAADEELPAEVGEFLDEQGRVGAVRVLKYMVSSPGHFGALLRMRARASRAAKSLRRGWQAVLPALVDLATEPLPSGQVR